MMNVGLVGPERSGEREDEEFKLELVPLGEATAVDEFGAKAARQAALLNAGFAVPDGVVLGCSAFRRWRSIAAIADDGAEEDALAPDVLEAVLASAQELGYPLAVRSSGLAEDLDGASFAGMYTSILNVDGPEALEAAVLACWRSVSEAHVAQYRNGRDGSEADGAMAVILQKMVAADVAGVAFTADPRTGDRTRVLIEAVRGLGDKLVSGECDPERWSVRGDEATCEQAQDEVLSEAQARAVADVADQVATWASGAPQDIEWAIAGTSVFVLQTRPITGLPDVEPIPIPHDPPPGEWGLETTHFDGPLSPLFASIQLPLYDEAANGAFREFGMPMERIEQRLIGGWAYVGVHPSANGKAPPPAWLMGLLVRLIPGMRAFCRRAKESQQDGRERTYVEAWHGPWREEAERGVDELDAVDISGLDDAELSRHIQRCLELGREIVVRHFKLHPPTMLAISDLVFFCRQIPDWTESQTIELLAGMSRISAEPGRKIAAIARAIEEHPEALKLAQNNPPDVLAQFERVAPEIWALFEDFQHRFGLRPLNFDIMSFTLREHPERTWNLIQGQLGREVTALESCAAQDELREAAVVRARESFLAPADRERFDTLLAHAQRTYPVREESEAWAFFAHGLARLGFLEAGRRMVDKGHLDLVDHVFFMTRDEVFAWLEGEKVRPVQIDRRRGERLWALANKPPAHLGPPSKGFPDVRFFPPEARRMAESIFWAVENDIEGGAVEKSGPPGVICGTGASSGRYTGPARIIIGPDDFNRILPGDVLVCPITTSAWSILFGHVGAIVTDAGGMLSHPAIIAREFGLPAVLGTRDGTAKLKDGQMITVDGSTGIVEVCS